MPRPKSPTTTQAYSRCEISGTTFTAPDAQVKPARTWSIQHRQSISLKTQRQQKFVQQEGTKVCPHNNYLFHTNGGHLWLNLVSITRNANRARPTAYSSLTFLCSVNFLFHYFKACFKSWLIRLFILWIFKAILLSSLNEHINRQSKSVKSLWVDLL